MDTINQRTAGKFLLGLVLGAAAGACTAILMAPCSGEQTLARLETKSDELRTALQQNLGDMREKTMAGVETIKHKTAEQASVAKEKAGELLHKASRTISEFVPKETQLKIVDDLTNKVKGTLKHLSSEKPA